MAGNVNTIDKTTDDQKGGGTSYLGKLDNNKNFDIGKLTQKKSEIDVTEDTKNEIETLGYLPSYGVSVGYDKKSNPNYDKWDAKNSFPDKFTEDSSKKSISINTKSIGNKNENYTMPSDPESSFKFDTIHDFEDPTFLTFDIIMYLDQRALWDPRVGYGVDVFLNRYNNISKRVEWRQKVLYEFRNQIKSLFYTSDDNYGSDNLVNKKSYYVNKIQGLQNLKKPIIKYKDDKITITLSEDLKMKAEYITELYNNLSYDYLFKREAIPESCLRFDMAIVISDIRKFKKLFSEFQNTKNNIDNEPTDTETINSNNNVFEKLTDANNNDTFDTNPPSYKPLKEIINRSNVSRQVYILRDCTFDFSKSQNVENQLIQGGFNSSPDTTPSSLEFDIYYKSAERTFFADLFQSTKDGKGGNLTLPTHNLIYSNEERIGDDSYYRDKHEKILYNRFKYEKQGIAKPGTPLTNKSTDEKGEENKRTFFGGLLEKTKDKLIDTTSRNIDNFKNRALQEFRELRGELLNTLIQELRDTTQVPSIQPDNVYDPDFGKLSLENFIKGLGSDLYNDIESSISGGINDAFNQAGL